MRPLTFKLLTFALTLLLLLSFSLLAFALPERYWLVRQELDEQPYPHAASNTTYFIVLKTTYGLILIPIFVKTGSASNSDIAQKQNDSRRANEIGE